METTIKIDGKDVNFKATAGVIYRYRNQFGRDLFADQAKMQEFADSKTLKKVKGEDGKITFQENYDFTKLDMTIGFNIAWVCAKTADESIPDPQEWLDSFNVFPLNDIIPKITNMINESNGVSNPKN